MNPIRKEYEKIVRSQEGLVKKLRELREKCSHERHTAVPVASTGIFDPSNDFYHFYLKCDDCGHQAYQDQAAYLQAGMKWPKREA
jgi:hypothetical protein